MGVVGSEMSMKATGEVLVSSPAAPDLSAILQRVCGALGRNLTVIENVFNVRLRMIQGGFQIESSTAEGVERARDVVRKLLHESERGRSYSIEEVRQIAGGVGLDDNLGTTVTGKFIQPKTLNQKKYVESIRGHDLTVAVGPAGTGKTYLAVATALEFLRDGRAKRVILTRPVVEAGERLGFLPGGYQEKINPYLRPLFDAIYDQLTPEKVIGLIDKQIIEIAPLAYMRGRTFNEAFVILDEAQNTTPPQMLMFLTRMGANSRMVINGDITQIDLQGGSHSGLVDAVSRLRRVTGVAIQYFDKSDVVRHALVTRILSAYHAPSPVGAVRSAPPARAGKSRAGRRHG